MSDKPNRNAPPPKAEQKPLWMDLALLVMKLAFIAVFLALLFTFLFGITQCRDQSMDPAVREGDLIVYYRLKKDYAAGDVIIVKNGDREEPRRVIAVAGDTVDFSEDGILINGYRQSEERIYTETLPFTEGITYPITIGPGQVFVLGDNRPSSEDSRYYGPVDIETGTAGKVMTVIRRRGF